MKKLILSALLIAVVAVSGFAASHKAADFKSLNGGKFAVGYIHNGFGLSSVGLNSAGSLAVRYDLGSVADNLSVEGSFGFVAGDSPDFFAVGVKGIYDLQKYSSFDLYVFAGSDYVSADSGNLTGSVSSFTLSAGAGIEYFIAQNLSLSTELGLEASFGDNNTSFGTFGNWLSNLGVRYYFSV